MVMFWTRYSFGGGRFDTGLLLKIMRQFESVYEKKSFYLVKNGAVGWITAYVNQNSSN